MGFPWRSVPIAASPKHRSAKVPGSGMRFETGAGGIPGPDAEPPPDLTAQANMPYSFP